jgi:hypothetical protein
MEHGEKGAFTIGVILGVVLGICATSFLWMNAFRELQSQAVKRNYASWPSNEYGRTKFQWKDEVPE